MAKFKELAKRNTLAVCIYFAGMMIAAAMPILSLYLLLYAVGCR